MKLNAPEFQFRRNAHNAHFNIIINIQSHDIKLNLFKSLAILKIEIGNLINMELNLNILQNATNKWVGKRHLCSTLYFSASLQQHSKWGGGTLTLPGRHQKVLQKVFKWRKGLQIYTISEAPPSGGAKSLPLSRSYVLNKYSIIQWKGP